MSQPKVLMVLSSADSFDMDGKPHPTGWYLPEFAHPYNKVAPVAEVVVASPKGGKAPLDPNSVEAFKEDTESVKFLKEKSALWENTFKLGDFRGKASEFAAIFFVGGHGPMIDLAIDETSHAVVREFWEAGKVVAAVCHGPAALAKVKLSDGSYLVDGSAVTGFTNDEEDAIKLSKYMPFMLETELIKNGGKMDKADIFKEKVVIGKEGRLITGQNPASASPIGAALVKAIGA
jgi:putative intracellular protease/amidase